MTSLGLSWPSSLTHRKPTTEACVRSRSKSSDTRTTSSGSVQPSRRHAELMQREEVVGPLVVAEGFEAEHGRCRSLAPGGRG